MTDDQDRVVAADRCGCRTSADATRVRALTIKETPYVSNASARRTARTSISTSPTVTEGAPGADISKLLATTGLVTYDPGFANTASCSSAITYIDGDAGILRYRGYPIDQLAEHSTFLETSATC